MTSPLGQLVITIDGRVISSTFTVVEVVDSATVVDVVVVLDVLVEVVIVVVESWVFVVVVVVEVLFVVSTGSVDSIKLSDSDEPQEMRTNKRKIIVSGTESNLNPTPELTWTLILGLARNIKEEIDNMYQGYWQTTVGVELKGKILGLIGLGKVGSQVAKIGKAFGMEVMAWSENLNLDKCKELDVLPCSKEDLIKNSDFLSIHVQGGERYKDCITLKELDKMKKTAFLINTSRGPIINEDDLVIALSTNEIAGAGLDVYEKEPLPENNKLRFLPNALLTPHIGYVTAENYSIFYTQMIEALEACVNGKPIRELKRE